MTDTRDQGDRAAASPHSPAGETGHSHLAHWPPPQRGHEVKHVPVKHQPAEQAQHEKPHGWGLTRSVFRDESDD